jgi:hypothetical protein
MTSIALAAPRFDAAVGIDRLQMVRIGHFFQSDNYG